jgi:TetR/AcrR family transcriptional repressor of nem operon
MDSRQKILTEASELIHTKGFNHTSIQDILEAATVTKSNFYYHFESKEQLAFEVLGQRMRHFYSIVIEPSLGNTSLNPLRKVEVFFDKMLALGQSPAGELGCPFGNLAQEISSLHEPLRQSLSMFFRVCTEALEQCFEQGKKARVFKKGIPSKQLAEFVIAQIQGSFLLRKTHKDPKFIKGNIEMLRNVIKQWS